LQIPEILRLLDIRVLQKPKAQGEREKRNITEDVQLSEKLTAWEKTWLVSGKLDVFRKKYGNIAISEEQINSTKRLLAIYLTKLHNITEGKVVRESLQSISTNSIELVKILAGIHNEQLSDIKYLVENFSLAQDNALAAKLMEKEEEGAVELPETVSSSSSSEKASTRNNEEAPSIIDNLQESAVSRQGFKEMEEQTFIELIDLRKKTADLIRLIAPYSKDSDMQALLATQKLLKEQELALSRAKTKDGLEEFDARVLAFNKTVRDLARRIDQILEEEASATTVTAEEPSTEDEPTVTAPPSNPFLRRLTPTIEEGNKTVVDVDARDITEYETRDEATEAIKKSQTSSRRPFDVFKNFMRTGVKTNEAYINA
jgi:hypothetical protein